MAKSRNDEAKTTTLDNFSEEELLAELARRRAEAAPTDMSSMELGLEEQAAGLGELSMEAFLRRLEKGEDCRPKRCPNCGRRVPVKTKDRPRTIRTLAGEHRFTRHYHYCRKCSAGFCPLDEELGLPAEGELSGEMEKRVLDFAVNDTYGEAAARWEVHYRSTISENLARRVAERVGRVASEADPEHLQRELLTPKAQPPQTLQVALDGSMLPMRGADPWREMKLGVVARGEHVADGGCERRGVVSEARYVCHLEGVEGFKQQLDAALLAEQAADASRVVWLGDGAPWIWNAADELCPNAIQVLDWPHAVEHGAQCGKAVLGDQDPLLSLWVSRIKELLWSGQIRELQQELEACRFLCRGKARQAIVDLQRYYRTNAKRLRYAYFRSLGLPIGSGIIESGHRHVLQKRMKLAGQHWSPSRAESMGRLRTAYKTAGPAATHAAIMRTKKQARAA